MHFLFPNFERNETFRTSYKCHSVAFFPGNSPKNVDNGGKIIMPPSTLDALTRNNAQYPILFKLTNTNAHRSTHCGVLEFIAEEGHIYVPYWILHNLCLEEGGRVLVENVVLPVATFVRFQPQSTDFLDISNPKAVLEKRLRDFACFTVGDMLAINYNDRVYELKVLETKPKEAVSIIECDMSVDFAPPVGYQEPHYGGHSKEKEETKPDEDDHIVIPDLNTGFKIFGGSGNRLDGKGKSVPGVEKSNSVTDSSQRERGIPNYDYKPGSLTFFRNTRAHLNQAGASDEPPAFKPFEGAGHQLKPQTGHKT